VDPGDAGPLSFIVRIWLEEHTRDTGAAMWRGHVTHVPSGERRYIQSLDEITRFIEPYLERFGVRLTSWRRLRRWLSQHKRTSRRRQ